MSRRRIWLFRLLSVVLGPLLFLGLIEGTLRAAGYGFPPTPIVADDSRGVRSYHDNVKFGWQFFPRNIARELNPFVFPAKKAEGTYRIFVLGGSAALGTPDPAYGFWRVLNVLLADRYPSVHFEVIPVAMVAINSHVVLKIAEDCARHEPDLFIVYLGNNEVVGPYGPGTVFSPMLRHLSLIRAQIAFKGLRLGQWLTDTLESTRAGARGPDVWGGMEMFLEKQVRRDDPRLEKVYGHFRKNLEDITRVGEEAAAQVILCTVASNLKDCPPFASLHRPDLTPDQEGLWDDSYRRGVEYEGAQQYREAIGEYLAAAKIDDRHADLQFRLGRCHWALGEFEAAGAKYIQARELDTLRFRADESINAVIREVAREGVATHVHLADAVEAFAAHSPQGTVGQELLYEHVHMNFHGNYLLAMTVLRQVEANLPQWVVGQRTPQRSELSEAECARRLAYTDLVRYNLASSVLNTQLRLPPFTNQLYHNEQITRLEEDLAALKSTVLRPESLASAADQCLQAIQQQPSDWRLRWAYALLLSDHLKKPLAAAEQYRWVMERLPHSYRPHLSLGVELAVANHLDEAKEHLETALRIKPTCATAYYYLGVIAEVEKRFEEAIERYSTTIRVQSNYIEAYNNLSGLLFNLGKEAQAVQLLRQALLFAPLDQDLHYNLALFLMKQGRGTEAIQALHAALQIAPDSVKLRKMLQTLQQGRE